MTKAALSSSTEKGAKFFKAVQIGDGICRARYGYIDPTGDQVMTPKLTSASSFKNGLAVVRRRGRRYRQVSLVINRSGQVVVELPFQRLEPFFEGLAAASSGAAYGFIDIENRWVIKPQFDQVEPFKDGLAEVQRGDWSSGQMMWAS